MPSVEQNNKQAYLAKAEDNINEAIRLKSDYGSAYVLLANIYEQGGKINEAIARLEGPSVANDPGSIFQLGYLYYRQDKLSQAKNKFEKAVGLVNNFSNAKYFLGLIYDREGNSVDALQQFQTILSLNPGNQEVIKIIKNIKSGQPALTGLTSASVVPSEEPKTAPSQPGL